MSKPISLSEVLKEPIFTNNQSAQARPLLTGVLTGFDEIDWRLGGLHGSELIVIAGRPSVGKTAMALNIAFNAAKAFRYGMEETAVKRGVVIYFTLESTSKRLGQRILSDQSEVGLSNIIRGELPDEEAKRILDVKSSFGSLALFIDDTPRMTVDQIREKCLEFRSSVGVGLVLVDYIQLLQAGDRAGEGRFLEIAEITAGLKLLAKELHVPIIALSQLSRAIETRDNRRPILTDLSGSGAIENDADVVLFIIREECHVERQKPEEGTPEFQEWLQKMMLVTGRAEVIIGKQRHGPVGSVQLAFESQFTRFGNLARDQYMAEQLE